MHASRVIALCMDKPPLREQVIKGAAVMEAARPKIIQFGFKDYIVDDSKKRRTAVCKVCSSKISDTTTTTSNFIRHYKTHKKR